jgi:hypothetical protein
MGDNTCILHGYDDDSDENDDGALSSFSSMSS